MLGQDYGAIESIVVDGGSTDGSVEILRSYGERVRWVSEIDRGQAHALNKGFAMARGSIVAWINSDDLMLPGAARLAAEALQAEPELGFVYGNGWIVGERGERREQFPYTEPFNLWRLIHFGDTILQQSVFIRRPALDAVGGVDESLRWGLDWDLFIRLGKRFPARMIDADMGAIRVHGATKTSTGGRERLQELSEVIRRHASTRWTPSFAGLALETAYGAATSMASNLPDAFEKPALRLTVLTHQFVSRRVLPAMEECQGWLSDGWAAPSLHVLFPAACGGGDVQLEGRIPEGGQVLTILWDGRKTAMHALSAGQFRLESRVPRGNGKEAPHLELRAERIAERRRRYHGGNQELCYRLDRVTMKSGGGDLDIRPPRRLIPVPEASSEALG